MMKKLHSISSMIFTAVLCIVLCFAFAGCEKETTINQLISDYGIVLEGGDFAKGASLIAAPVEPTGEKGQEIISLLAEQTYAKDGEMSIYDIFVAKDGKEVQPNGKVKITLPAPFESENGYVTFHVKDDNSVETLETTYSEGKISFETDSFSHFVIAEDEKYYDFSLINVDGRGTVCFEDLELSAKGDALSTGRHAGKELPLAVKDIEDGYAFIGWFGSTDLSNVWDIKYDHLLSTETTFNFTMPANGYVIYAVFRPIQDYYTLGVINVNGLGTVGVDGIEASDESDLSFARTVGSESVLVAKDTLDGYAFFGWYGTMDTSNVWALKYDTLLSTEKTFTFTMPNYDYIIYAVFKPVHTVYAFADKDTEGTIKWGENNESTAAEVKVGEGKSVALTAVPNQGYKFLGWYDEPKNENDQIGNLICEDATYTIAVEDTDVNIYARFEKIPVPVPEEYPLTVGQQGAGGSISINGDTPSSFESGPFYENYEAGTSITLIAETRSSAYIFKGWFEVDDTIMTHLVLKDTPVSAELTYTFTMPESAYTVYAVFEEAPQEAKYPFSAFVTGGSGVIICNNEEQPNGYQAELTEGSKVTLTASPSEGYRFVGWFEPDGAAVTTLVLKETPVSTSATYEFTMPAAEYTVYAVFEEVITYSFSAFIEGDGGYFEINGENIGPDYWLEKLSSGDTVSLKVVANTGYDFKGWYAATDIPEFISASAEYTFTVGSEDISVMAVFEAKVTGLILDAANAGFTEGKATYTIGDENKPNPEYVVVSGATAEGHIALVKDTDYTIDLGGLDFAKAGTYTITYTYRKDTTIKDTLTVEVVAPKYLFSAVVGTSGGLIYQNDTELPNGYAGEHLAGETVTLKAVAGEGYEFVGWYTNTDTPELISASAEYTFTIENKDMYVKAVFEAKVTALLLDAANAGFTEGTATYTIGGENKPNPEYVVVSGVTVEENVSLTKDVDYTIDLGGLDLTKAGTYTITYVYSKDASIKATLQVTVIAAAEDPATLNLAYTGSIDSASEYNGGRAAYVFKNSFTNNGEVCDIEDLGLFYEWRDHTTKEVVTAARDDTWGDDAGHFPSPAVVGVYDFVVYMMEGETKVDLLTLTRTIEVNRFSLVDGTEGLSESTCYTFIAKVGDRYFAMSNPFEGNCERAAIEVFPDENGIISLGEQYEYVFRPYDSYKVADNGLTKYRLRTGMGLNRTGNLILWDTGHIEYNTSVSADYTVTFTFGEDSTATVHAPYCGGTLRLVYDDLTDSYLFTAKSASEDERPSYPVYLYGEYVEVVEPTETYDFYNKLSKAYDGEAVSFNIYKDVYISTENGDLATLLKMEMGRFVWTDLKFNLISVGEVGEDGMTVTGPSDVGAYQLVFQTLEKGEEGMVWTDKAILHTFEIYEATTES